MSKRFPYRKAVIPAAGRGTRMLPQTWATPKELLPLVDRPILHYVVEEAAQAGFSEIILVVSPGKESIAGYFEHPAGLLAELKAKGKEDLMAPLLELQKKVKVRMAVQKEPRGLGHAVLCAREVVGGEPFAVLLPDEVFEGRPGPLEEMIASIPGKEMASVALLEVGAGEVSRYGIVGGKERDGILYIDRAVEKPAPRDTPSRLAIVGRYLLPADVFGLLEALEPSAAGEIQLTDALTQLAARGRLVGQRISAARFDTGHPQGWLAANAHFGGKFFGGGVTKN